MDAVLLLQVPGKNQVPVVMDANPHVLRMFKKSVLARYEWALIKANTPAEHVVQKGKLEHMRYVLDYLIPEEEEVDSVESPGSSD